VSEEVFRQRYRRQDSRASLLPLVALSDEIKERGNGGRKRSGGGAGVAHATVLPSGFRPWIARQGSNLLGSNPSARRQREPYLEAVLYGWRIIRLLDSLLTRTGF
jgi:hypothetical protein